jgi:hypothetical protein
MLSGQGATKLTDEGGDLIGKLAEFPDVLSGMKVQLLG